MLSESLNFIKFVRDQGCLLSGVQPDVHHLQTVGTGRNRKKLMWEHFSAVPLCRELHQEVEYIGLNRFQQKHHINLWQENHRLLMRFLKQKELL